MFLARKPKRRIRFCKRNMSYFSSALDDALKETGLNQRDLAKAAGVSPGTISKIKKDVLECTREQLAAFVQVFAPWPQAQWNLVIARCKDFVPEEFRPSLDALTWTVEESQAEYRLTDSSWDKAIKCVHKKGLHNESLRSTIEFLAEVAS